jgi:hypothetical protein
MTMKTRLLTILLIILACSAFAADYEVTIDGTTFLFSEGVEQKVAAKNGQQVVVTVSAVMTKNFQEHGISFRYPSDMKISQESFNGIELITLEALDSSLFMMKILPSSTSTKQTEQDLVAEFREEFSNVGATFPANPTRNCQRSVGGKVRAGVMLSSAFGSLAHETEIYTMEHNGKTVALVFQHAVEDKEKAQLRFTIVTESFK